MQAGCTGLQAGCTGLQAGVHRAAGWGAPGCRLGWTGLPAPLDCAAPPLFLYRQAVWHEPEIIGAPRVRRLSRIGLPLDSMDYHEGPAVRMVPPPSSPRAPHEGRERGRRKLSFASSVHCAASGRERSGAHAYLRRGGGGGGGEGGVGGEGGSGGGGAGEGWLNGGPVL